MVNREANIDLLFRNGLSDYEAVPPSDVWEGIKPVVARPERSFLYMRIAASVAILVASGLLTALLVRNLPSGSENTVLQIAAGTRSVFVNRENIGNPGQSLAFQPIPDNKDIQGAVSDVKSPVPATSLFTLPSPELFTSFVRARPVKDFSNSSRPGSPQKANIPSYPDFVSDASVQVKEKVPAKDNRWSVGAMVSPAYYSWFSLSGNDAASEIIKSEDPAFSYTGGLTFAYNINRRLAVQSGLNYSSIGQRIEGVTSYSGFGKFIDSKGISQFGVVTSSGTITSSNRDVYLADNNAGARVMSVYTREVFDPVKNDLSYISSSLSQNFNYVEVPVYLKYKLIDRNVDVKVVGGVSYNVLVGNMAYTSSGGSRYYIGKTEGLSPVTLSSSLGMGMEYSFSGRLSLNLEPTFRYYITPLGGLAGSSIHPYSFGILSGISYKF